MRRRLGLALLLLSGCAGEELLHGLDELQANELLVALDEGGVVGEKRREEGREGGWIVTVPGRAAGRARRIVSDRELPRPKPPGFGEVFGGGGMVPTPVEEHARYLHALSGELSRSLNSLDGVVEARVHLGLPQDDPLQPGERRPPRAAVLLRCRPASCAAVRAMDPEIRALVAGSTGGLAAEAVSLLVAEVAPAPLRESSGPRGVGWRAVAAAALALSALLLVALALRTRLPTTAVTRRA
jgi:type III secretion protein J